MILVKNRAQSFDCGMGQGKSAKHEKTVMGCAVIFATFLLKALLSTDFSFSSSSLM